MLGVVVDAFVSDSVAGLQVPGRGAGRRRVYVSGVLERAHSAGNLEPLLLVHPVGNPEAGGNENGLLPVEWKFRQKK